MAILLSINKISKSFGPHIIFNEASFSVDKKQKIGVIGRNGAGKTTLFKMILGEEEIDSGEIVVFENTRIGYLEQQEKFKNTETVLDFLLRDSGKESWECAKMAENFQLKNDLLTTKIGSLSGGYRMRVKLTAMLLRDPNLLLLDEPTNHLDLSTLLLLEEFLKTYNGSYLVISHDREFLRNTCEETLEVDQGKLYFSPCPLDNYLELRELKRKTDEKYNRKIRRQKKHLQEFVDRFRYKASKAAQAQSKIKQIERLSEVEIRQALKTAQIVIPQLAVKKGLALRVEDLAIGYQDKQIAAGIKFDVDSGDHIAVLGDNGQGKTTFLKTIGGRLDKISGNLRWIANAKIAYYDQYVTSELNPKEQVGEYLERQAGLHANIEDIYRIAGNFLFYGDDIKKSIAMLSGGEKARLCLAGMLLRDCNILLLDEPTNHLDFETVETLGKALSGSKATIFFISHNRDFIHLAANKIIEVGDGRVKLSNYTYEDYLSHLYRQSGLKKIASQGAERSSSEDEKKEQKRLSFERRKELQKELSKIMDSIQYNKALEQKLLKEYEKDGFRYNREREEKMREARARIDEDEISALELEEELEKIDSAN